MPDENELARESVQHPVVAALQDMVLDSSDVEEFLTGLAEVSARVFPRTYGDVFCGVTLLRPRSMITVASSGARARQVDEIQYGFDDGPCLRAAREGYTVHVRDFLTETRFPEYRRAVASFGVRSALGIPIRLDDGVSAGLDFYSTEPNAFDDEGVAAAENIAQNASRSLRLAVRIGRLTDDARNLEAALSSRTTIDRAVGVIMAQNRCSQAEAIGILRRASTSRNIKLRDVAAGVLASLDQVDVTDTHFER
ncbi:GAF and ANTAR domain-containing protein [Arthrobacter echini]|uniref:GAF and ANTAR domain-containing protein n=1 Tax=Arthrobacter echini TaxID=1529066 RepID=A0A4S5EAK8_9MICC|nr:GAF and ANTAR domain-containing protein [Arthrobacter echini]THJ68652.1 GAF and ANTAR domain-containing protein [Arthrobacter echini]